MIPEVGHPVMLGVGLGLIGVALAIFAAMVLVAIINRRPWTLRRAGREVRGARYIPR